MGVKRSCCRFSPKKSHSSDRPPRRASIVAPNVANRPDYPPPRDGNHRRIPVVPDPSWAAPGRFFTTKQADGGGNDDLPQSSLKARAPRNSLIIKPEVISHNHFPTTRPEKRFSPLISRHRTRVTVLQQNRIPGVEPQQLRIRFSDAGSVPKAGIELMPGSASIAHTFS